jgi:hypothetical protein
MLGRWLGSNALSRLQVELRETGKTIVRGAPVGDASEVSTVASAIWGQEYGIMEQYHQGSVTREELGNGVLHVNLEPPEADVLAHTEMTYLNHFPAYIAFYVKTPAPTGGKTTITDNLSVTRALSAGGKYAALGDKLRLLGVEYSRHLCCEEAANRSRKKQAHSAHNPDPLQYRTWQDAFSTHDRQTAEKSLVETGAGALSWLESGGAVWRATRPAFSTNPANNVDDEIFMSQLFAMHYSGNSLVGSVYEKDVKRLANAGLLPYHSRWGDGSEFSTKEMATFTELHQTSFTQEVALVSGT